MKSWFLSQVLLLSQGQVLQRRNKKKAKVIKGIPNVTYHFQLKHLGRIINKNIYLLNMNEETKKVFSPRPMV